MAVGLFDTFFDSDHRQRRDVNNDACGEAGEALATVAESSAALGQPITQQRKAT